MPLFTVHQFEQLLENGRNPDADHRPVVKLFTPFAGCTWLLTELDPDNPDIAFGLCDLGLGFPELGYVYLPEITENMVSLRMLVESDHHFDAKFPISVYARAASKACQITEDEKLLVAALAEAQRSEKPSP